MTIHGGVGGIVRNQTPGNSTKIKMLMHGNLQYAAPDMTLQEVAQLMDRLECGILPVGKPGKAEGVITDRDIVLRAVTTGRDCNIELVKHYMTPYVRSCHLEQTIEHAAQQMNYFGVSRLLVEDDDGAICGIITLGGIMRRDDNREEVSNVIEHAFGNMSMG